MNDTEQKVLLNFARQSLVSYFENKSLPVIDSAKHSELIKSAGAFVSVYCKEKLRGCVGTIETNEPLCRTVQKMAIAAATRDFRFKSLSKDELTELLIEISVLSPFKLIKNFNDIEVGSHGLYIKVGNYHGLLLPQVADRYQWTIEEFLSETCRKAQLPVDAYKWKSANIFTFRAEIISERTVRTHES